MMRRGHRYAEAIKKVNDLLYMVCVAEGFVYLDLADITMAHVSADGIHLNSHGTTILLYNILSVFNTFNSELIDFMEDYKYAMSLQPDSGFDLVTTLVVGVLTVKQGRIMVILKTVYPSPLH